jgi:RNA polymerase sigma-70 factor (ECF subfamily)
MHAESVLKYCVDFERRINRHRDAVYRQLVRMCGNHDDAEDVFIEAMVGAFRAKEGLREEAAMQAWLVQIGRRACGRLKRRESQNTTIALQQLEKMGIDIPEQTDSPEDLLMETELKTCLHLALNQLGKIYQDAYQMVDVEGLSLSEAAKHLGVSENNLKIRLFRSRKMIRDKIDGMLCS